MKAPKLKYLILAIALIAFGLTQTRPISGQSTQATPPEWRAVEQAIGKTGVLQPGSVFKIGLPRTDLRVTIRGVSINTALALGAWIAFKKMGNDTVVMGDLVLTEDEVGPVMWSLQESGIEQTALHNHVFDESPRVMYMHIHGHGNALQLAASIRRALSNTKTPFEAPAGPTLKKGPPPEIDFHHVEQVIGRAGKENNGVYQFSIARTERITEGEMEIPPSMGVATAINFQPTGGGRAAITGDFVLLASEVNPVIHALRENGIAVTALHSHMLTESPRLFFMHFWANDDALKLAHGLRVALDQTNSAR
ncbi:MAG: hypothetical protein QOH41_2148 [Blastocatellia bacterium]|jgi:hypothetical protein|nr:hypothetical protein [Blastocatellia bacterium]